MLERNWHPLVNTLRNWADVSEIMTGSMLDSLLGNIQHLVCEVSS